MKDLVTVFTPVYNRKNLIGNLYQSLLSQTYKNFEWIIVDDGSTDDIDEIIKSYQNEDRILIRFIKQENGGKHRAINNGVLHAKGELFYIVDGAGQFQINDKLFPVQAHQLVVVNPNVIHTEVSLESHPLEYIVLGIEGLEFTISDAAEGSFCVYTFDGNNDVLPCMRKILTEMQNRESNFQILCQAYMDIIVVQLMRNASVSAVPIHSRLPANRQCATVKRYIDHHYKENLTLDELAEKVSISKYHMAHAFKREYGVSPINYIIDCRIREGKRLLAETDLAPSQIASILGFSSSSYFCKTFSNIEGTSPTEYRKANQVKF